MFFVSMILKMLPFRVISGSYKIEHKHFNQVEQTPMIYSKFTVRWLTSVIYRLVKMYIRMKTLIWIVFVQECVVKTVLDIIRSLKWFMLVVNSLGFN